MKFSQQVELSIVVPVYNEVPANLELLLQRLHTVLRPLFIFYEVVFVDDGSEEATASVLRGLPKRFPYVRCIFLSRNFGEQSAICAGLAHARGDVVVNMDSDLQDPPDLLPTMLQYWRDGHDVVSTKQVNRSDPFWQLIFVNVFYWILKKISPTTVVHAGEFRLLSRRAVDAFLSLPEKTVFLRYLIPWIGFKQITIVFERQKRTQGHSSYTFLRLLKLGLMGLIASSSFPLIFAPLFGLTVLSLGIILFCSMHSYFFSIHTWFILLWLAALINMISMMALACYVSVTLNEARGRPRFIVADILENSSAPRAHSQHEHPLMVQLNSQADSLTVSLIDKH